MNQKCIISGPRGSGKTNQIVNLACQIARENMDKNNFLVYIICANNQRKYYILELLARNDNSTFKNGKVQVITMSELKQASGIMESVFAWVREKAVLVDDIEDCFEVFISYTVNSFSFNDPHQDEVRKVIDNGNV